MFTIFCFIGIALAVDRTAFNNLNVYEIQVASYVDGDPNIGFEVGWGPTTTNFGGDLQGIINNLPKISEMGFNAIWLTPIFNTKYEEDQKDVFYCAKHSSCGYFIADYYNIDPHFGTNDKFKELVEVAHNNNIYVILDGVFGHIKPTVCGTGIPEHNGESPVCVEGACEADSQDSKVDYNQQETLDFFIDVAKYWITEYKIDGWRLDAPYELSTKQNNANDPETIANNIVYKIREAVEEAADANKEAGDTWGTLGFVMTDIKFEETEKVNQWYGEGEKISAYTWYDWPAANKLRSVLLQEIEDGNVPNYDDIETAINMIQDYPAWSYPIFCISNHDFLRLGNSIRARWGYEPSQSEYWNIHLAIQEFQFFYPGSMSMYYGDELGEIVDCYNIQGDCDASNDNAGRSNPTPESEQTDAQKQHQKNIKKLLNWRKTRKLATCKDCSTTVTTVNDMVMVKRTNDGKFEDDIQEFIYILNLNDQPKSITIENENVLTNVLTDKKLNKKQVEIPKHSSILIEVTIPGSNGTSSMMIFLAFLLLAFFF